MAKNTFEYNGQKIFISGNDDEGYRFSVLLKNGQGSGLVMAYDTFDIAMAEAHNWVDRYAVAAVRRMKQGTRVVDPSGNEGVITEPVDQTGWVIVDFGSRGHFWCNASALVLAISEPKAADDPLTVEATESQIDELRARMARLHPVQTEYIDANQRLLPLQLSLERRRNQEKAAEIERCHRLLVEVHKIAAHTKNEKFFESALKQIASMVHEALTGEQALVNGNE